MLTGAVTEASGPRPSLAKETLANVRLVSFPTLTANRKTAPGDGYKRATARLD